MPPDGPIDGTSSPRSPLVPPSPDGSAPAGASRAVTIFLLVTVPVLVLVGGVLAWIVVDRGAEEERTPDVVEIVVPAGTQDRLEAGEEVVIMPTRLEFRVGDAIRIRNDDDVRQSVGPYLVDAGEEMLLQYGTPGVYEGYCPLSEGERYEIVVTR